MANWFKFSEKMPTEGKQLIVFYTHTGDIPLEENALWCHCEGPFTIERHKFGTQLVNGRGEALSDYQHDAFMQSGVWAYAIVLATEAMKDTGFHENKRLVFEPVAIGIEPDCKTTIQPGNIRTS